MPEIIDDISNVLDRLTEAKAIDDKERILSPIIKAIEKKVGKVFLKQGRLFTQQFNKFRGRFPVQESFRESDKDIARKMAQEAADAVDRAMDMVELNISKDLTEATQGGTISSMEKGFEKAAMSLSIDYAFNIRHPRAENYVIGRGAALITKINETTRFEIKQLVIRSVVKGINYNKTAEEITRRFKEFAIGKPQLHIRSRAHLVAITEAGQAYEAGGYEIGNQLKEVGIQMEKYWATVGDNRVSDGCSANEGQGWIAHDDAFESGHEHPLRFPGCYSDDTEIYTNGGWIKFKDITLNHKCLSLDPDTFDLSWEVVIKKYEFEEKEKMIRFHGKRFDLLVSQDHNIFSRTAWYQHEKKHKWGFERADKFLKYPKGGEMYRSSNWVGKNNPDRITIGDVNIPIDLYLFFMGIYLSGGSVTVRSKKWTQISIHQSEERNPENYEIIKRELSKIPANWRFGKDKFYCNNRDLGWYLVPFGKCDKKYVPEEIKQLPHDKIRIFLDAYCMGDGHTREYKEGKYFPDRNGGKKLNENYMRPEISYTTSSKRMADDLGELILKCGKRPSFSTKQPKPTKHKNGTYTGKFEIWDIRECYSQRASVQHMKIEEVPYNGMIYCVDIEKHHTLLVRRNGKVVWSGNCRCALLQRMKNE